jgi:hypothetical protein
MSLEKRILKLAQNYDFIGELLPNQDLKFAINCSDVFMWGCADAEEIETAEDVDLLQQACRDSNDHGWILYCVRKRGIRPQGSYYKSIDKNDWQLFNDCGPIRDLDFGNPKMIGE